MLDFTRSFITWTTHPRKPHPYYRWDGGFVGEFGDAYRVRMQVDSTMHIRRSVRIVHHPLPQLPLPQRAHHRDRAVLHDPQR